LAPLRRGSFEEVHFKKFREDVEIEHLIKPISAFLVPVFFVMMGIQVRLETFAQLSVLGVAADSQSLQ
jgi:Kef-type K+ transport system membrane component KefB